MAPVRNGSLMHLKPLETLIILLSFFGAKKGRFAPVSRARQESGAASDFHGLVSWKWRVECVVRHRPGQSVPPFHFPSCSPFLRRGDFIVLKSVGIAMDALR